MWAGTQANLYPPELKPGKLISPYGEAKRWLPSRRFCEVAAADDRPANGLGIEAGRMGKG